MYTWIVFAHVASTFGFLFAHGVSAVVMFKVRAERDPARICTLLELSSSVGGAMTLTAVLLLLTGLAGGFMGGWWDQGWIWVSLGLFLAISVVMSWQGRVYFERLRRAIGIPTGEAPKKEVAPPAALPPDQLAAVLVSGRPVLLAVVGLGGLAAITWLMVFKPF